WRALRFSREAFQRSIAARQTWQSGMQSREVRGLVFPHNLIVKQALIAQSPRNAAGHQNRCTQTLTKKRKKKGWRLPGRLPKTRRDRKRAASNVFCNSGHRWEAPGKDQKSETKES